MPPRRKDITDLAWERAQAEFSRSLSRAEQLRLVLETEQFQLIQQRITELGGSHADHAERLTVALATLFLANGKARPVLYRPNTLIVGKQNLTGTTDTAPFFTGEIDYRHEDEEIYFNLNVAGTVDIVLNGRSSTNSAPTLARYVPIGKTPGALSSLDKKGAASAGIITNTAVGGVQLERRPNEIFDACKRENNPGLKRPVSITLNAIEKKDGNSITYAQLIDLAKLAYNQATLINNNVFKDINKAKDLQANMLEVDDFEDEDSEIIRIKSEIKSNATITTAEKVTATEDTRVRLKPGQLLYIHSGKCEIKVRKQRSFKYSVRAVVEKGSVGERIFAGAHQDTNTSFNVKEGSRYSIIDAADLKDAAYARLIEKFTVLYLRKVRVNNEQLANKDEPRNWIPQYKSEALKAINRGVERSPREEKSRWAEVVEELFKAYEDTRSSIYTALGIKDTVDPKDEDNTDDIAPNAAARLAELRSRDIVPETDSDRLTRLAEIRTEGASITEGVIDLSARFAELKGKDPRKREEAQKEEPRGWFRKMFGL